MGGQPAWTRDVLNTLARMRTRWLGAAALALACLWLSGCATLPRNAVPIELAERATVPGMPDVRASAGTRSEAMERDFLQSLQDESPSDFPVDANGEKRYPQLALSGGGSFGAFGAGFLSGWTATGRRPVFKIVTGVSTGALMAPFAFLGPRYDEVLTRLYTTTRREDVLASFSAAGIVFRQDSLARSEPLASLIAHYVDAPLLAEIAAAHRNGRRLYMGTANLDSREFVVWNMGLIATHADARALELFRTIMLASSSVPIVFPPVLVEVQAGGKLYDEMHVDGFIGANVFVNVGVLDTSRLYRQAGRTHARDEIFVIHNGQLDPPPQPAARSFRGIATRVIESSGRSTIIGDLFREYAFAQRNGSAFHWVTIDAGIELGDPLAFDPDEMAHLVELGQRAAQRGPVWYALPPGIGGNTP